MPKRRARGGNVRSKYYGDDNLQIINSTGFISIPAKNVEVPKNLDLLVKKGETRENAQSFNKNMPIEKDDASTKKCDTARNRDSMQFKQYHNQQKKDIPKNVGSHYLSNFLALSQTDKTLPKVEIQKHSQYFKNKPSSSEIASGSKISVKDIPSEQKISKAIPTKTPTKTSIKKEPKTKNEIACKIKKKTDSEQFDKEHFDNDYRDLRFLSPSMERSRVKDKFPEHLKESPYRDFEFSAKKEDKLRGKPGSSRKFGSPYTNDSSFFKKELYSSRHSLPYGKGPDLRKISKSSREYSYRERYYKSKSDKYNDRKKDYMAGNGKGWQKMERHFESKYSWYNKDYVYKKKHAEKPHSSKMRHEYPKEKRDFHLEDYEEVVSLEDSSDDLKVPVRFRKCLVRYLSYTVYNYFRPKWYFLSRKRHVVNCLYATGKKGNVSEKKLEILEPCPEEVVNDEDIADNATIVDEEAIADELLVDEEDMENVETLDHALLNDGKTIEDGSGENIETIHVTLLNTDNEEAIGAADSENVVSMDDALLDDDNGDVDGEIDEMLDDALLEDDKDELINDVDGENDETLDDVLLEDDNGELIGDADGENDELMDDVLLEDGNGVIIADDENEETVNSGLLNENVETTAEADGENVEMIDEDNGENNEVTSMKNAEKINDALLVDNDKSTKDPLDDETIGNTLLDGNEGTTNNIPSTDTDEKKGKQYNPDIGETEDVSATDNSIQTEKISIVEKEVVNESTLSPQTKESIEQESNEDDEICILHVGKKVKDAICIVIDDQKESDDTYTVQDGSKEKIDVGVVQDNKEKIGSSSIVLCDETDSEDICILHEKVTKQNIAKCVKKFNDAQKQSNKITRNYLKLQQISSKKIVPNKKANNQKGKDNLPGVGNNTEKVQDEDAKSLQTKSNQANNKDKKDSLIFYKCDSNLEFNSEFMQGDSAIQSNLSEWNSHLIGLEYMLEVQDNVDEKVIKKYHCVLCTEDFPHQETIVQVVIKHITSYKHMCNYMAKHFPSSDYNFSESVRSYVNEIMLQTCCEEINHKLGYNFMCIVKENFFEKEYDKIQEHFSAMKHWGESDIDIFPQLIVKQLESDVRKDAGCVIEDILCKVVPPEPKETFFIPQTIVSSSRRASPKDKVKDILKTSESMVIRSSQNTLIVLTTASVPAKTPLVAGLSSPKKLAASSTKNNKALMNTIRKGNIQEEELTSQEEQTQDVVIDPNLDKELKTSRDGDLVLTEQDGLRVVRLRTTYNRPLKLGDSDEEEEVGLNIPVQESVEIKPSIEGDGVTDNLQAEEISDNDFSDVDEVEVHSPEVDRAAPKSQKQPHKKSMHSKYCPKRKAWIRGDSQQTVGEKESLRNVYSPNREISTIGKPSKRYSSHFHKKYDERSQDSYTSSVSKRRRRSPSSSSPSLEEFLRKLSPSPVRKRSPLRISSSYRKPVGRRNSRSPYKKHSRSPALRHSKSPYRKRSKSPFRRRSKSPIRRRSRSPYRKRSRSPVRRRSRSPFKLRSRSPIRKPSRSPIRKRSRSPRSRSPLRKRSRSPYSSFKSIRNERSLRSPVRKSGRYNISRSPDKPPRKYSRSPSRRHARPRSPLANSGMVSRIPGSYKRTSSSILPHHHSNTESRKERNDLEEISDEDESKYFNTSTSSEKIPQYMDEIIQTLPESARIMLVKVMQRFSITNINVNDPSFYELMKFVASHSSEIQSLMSQPSALPEMSSQVPSKPSAQSQESFLHQYILTGMKGHLNTSSEAGPSSANVFPGPSGINFQQPPRQSMAPSPQFLSQRPDLTHLNQFGQPVYQQPTSSVYPVQGMHATSPNFVPQQQQMAMNIPMAQQPQQFHQEAYKLVSPPKPTIPPPQPKRTSEGVFQDLKATVSKIFGGEDALAKLGFKIPGLNDHPVEAKYSGSSQNVPPVNPGYQSPHGNKMGQYFKKEAPTQENDNFTKNYAKKEQVFLSETSRETPHVPPPDAKVSFCDVQRPPMQKNLFPVVNIPQTSYKRENVQASINDAKKSLAQRLAAVLVKVGMVDVPAHLLQEMLMKIGAFSLNPPQDISEGEILTILRKLKYVL